MITKCACQRCGKQLEFESQDAGRCGTCPHCNMETTLFTPHKPIVRAVTLPTESNLSRSTIVCSYALCVLMPFFGFFAGIYLMAKKEIGHGVACIALSILFFGALLALFSL